MGAPVKVRLSVVVAGQGGRVQVRDGAGTLWYGRLPRSVASLAVGEEISLRLVEPGIMSPSERIGVLGRVLSIARSREHAALELGLTFEVEALRVQHRGADVPPPSLFGIAHRLAESSRAKASPSPANEEASGLVGSLRHFGVVELVQALEVAGKTARADLLPASGGRPAHLFFDGGHLVHAEWGELEGEEAFFHLVELDDGSFRVCFGIAPKKRTLDTLGQHLLLEALRRRDEAFRDDEEITRTIVTPRRSSLKTETVPSRVVLDEMEAIAGG